MRESYIGIADFTDFQQVQQMLEVFTAFRLAGSKRMLQVGAMMSQKTLNDLPTVWANAFPPKENIAHIFGSDGAYNCLHYVDYYHSPDFRRDLTNAISFCGARIDALQLDMIWPSPVQVAEGVIASRKRIDVILQIGRKALEIAGNDPKAVVARLADYEGVIQRVLLDKRMGRGLGMNARVLLPFVRAIKEAYPTLGVGVAAGLGPKTMRLAEPLIGEFPDLSFDAQANLHRDGSALKPIDLNLAEAYLVKALALVHQLQPQPQAQMAEA